MYSKISNNKEEYFFIEALRVMVIFIQFYSQLNWQRHNPWYLAYFVSGLPFYR